MKPKIFISWSGSQSHALASILHEWLPKVLPSVDPWMSSEDIDKGRQWTTEIGDNLGTSSYCIVCVTPGVAREPWVNFETGAIYTIAKQPNVSPLLHGVTVSDLRDLPLAMFQCTTFDKNDVLKLLKSIYRASGDNSLSFEQVVQNFELEWPRLADEVSQIPPHIPVTILDEIRHYLADISQWSLSPRDDGCNGDYYHLVHPDIAIVCSDAPEYMARNEEWTRGEVRKDNNHAGFHDIYHNQQRLARVRYVSFDDHKKSMVAPKWEPCGRGRFYYYESESVEYAVHRFYCQLVRRDDSQKLHIGGRNGDASIQLRELMKRRTGKAHYYRIPVLRAGEFETFRQSSLYPQTDSAHPASDEDKQYQLFLQNQLAFELWRADREREPEPGLASPKTSE